MLPHVLAINYVYDVPNLTKHFSGPKWLSYITDSFQVSGVTQFMSGAPIDPGIWWPPPIQSTALTMRGGLGGNAHGSTPLSGSNAYHRVGTSKWDPAAFQPPNIGPPIGRVA